MTTFVDENDPDVLFHGTSYEVAQQILATGLRAASSPLTETMIRDVVNAYREIGWAGATNGGFSTLGSYSIADCDRTGPRPTFLAATVQRAVVYATRDRAGGEAMSAMRIALSDLRALSTISEIHEEYVRYCANRVMPTRPIAQRRIASYVETFQHVEALCAASLEAYSGGAVLTVRPELADLPFLDASDLAAGIIVRAVLPPGRITRVTRLAADYEPSRLDTRSCEEWPAWNGIIRRLRPANQHL